MPAFHAVPLKKERLTANVNDPGASTLSATQNRSFFHASRVSAKPCTRTVLRPLTPLSLMLVYLFAACAAGAQLDHHDGVAAGSRQTLNIAGVFQPTAYASAAADATSTNPGTISSLPVQPGKAFDLSLNELLDNAEGALERFKKFRREADLFLGLDADMDDRVVYRSGVLVQKMSMLIREVREATDGVSTEALAKQAPDVRAAGIRLFLVARQVDLLMEEQGRCGLRNLGLLLSAIESLALELDYESPDGRSTASRLQYFFFPNHLPDVMPVDGGWLIVVGSGLWRDGAPTVTAVDHDSGKISAPLEIRHTGIDQAIAVRIDRELIAANMGRCLFLTASPDQARDAHRQQRASKPGAATLPLCIPLSFNTRYKIAGFLEYRTPTRTTRHKSRSMLFENTSCTDPKQVSESLEWELNPGGRLTNMGESALYEAGATAIDCGMAENRIVCQGYLGPAVCNQEQRSGVDAEQQPSLLEKSEWEHIFTPTEEYPEEQTHHGWALSEPVDLDQSPVQLELKVPREKLSKETTMWYELIIVNGGQERTLFVSPKKTLAHSEQDSYVVGGNQVEEEFTPAPDAGAAKIRLSIESAACRY